MIAFGRKFEIDGSTYIMRACQAEQHPALSLEVVRALLSKNKKVLKEVCSENHWTALHYCAAHNAADIAELLLSHERLLDEGCDHLGQSALHVASVRGSYEVCKLLLSGSSNLDKELNTPADLAATKEIEALFLAHTGAVNIP